MLMRLWKRRQLSDLMSFRLFMRHSDVIRVLEMRRLWASGLREFCAKFNSKTRQTLADLSLNLCNYLHFLQGLPYMEW
jgi:hypothetical protein